MDSEDNLSIFNNAAPGGLFAFHNILQHIKTHGSSYFVIFEDT